MKDQQHEVIVNGKSKLICIPKRNFESMCNLILKDVLKHIEKENNKDKPDG